MKSFVLLGNLGLREGYIAEFISKNEIKAYNIFEYKEKLKISDVGKMKRHWSIKSNEKKLFLFWNEISADVQNALLKSVEELPENIDIILSSNTQDSMLPTILSRSFIVRLGGQGVSDLDIKNYKEMLAACFDQKGEEGWVPPLLHFIEYVVEQKDEDDYLKVVLSLRELILEKAKENVTEEKNLVHMLKLLSLLHEYSSLVFFNNLNRRIVFERIVFSLS
ncbi:MAG: hypothetical protein COU27_00545 [Candidatus Levybacteria bacterium CG10_big_fil_rev_8_21_14_0_10_36_7]|nr:MAG: hypothetical protein COU27_00545 [Candidatus Levybacteria bacterium CG10_big_fil_rev_8_21_14_0_10_36_7]